MFLSWGSVFKGSSEATPRADDTTNLESTRATIVSPPVPLSPVESGGVTPHFGVRIPQWGDVQVPKRPRLTGISLYRRPGNEHSSSMSSDGLMCSTSSVQKLTLVMDRLCGGEKYGNPDKIVDLPAYSDIVHNTISLDRTLTSTLSI